MLEKKIKFIDFNGEEREETFCFNLTRTELIEMQLEVKGGLNSLIEKMAETKDIPSLANLFTTVIKKSYGVKSADGRNFRKSEEIWDDFHSSAAYDALFMEITQDTDSCANFINGIMPPQLIAEAEKQQKKSA